MIRLNQENFRDATTTGRTEGCGKRREENRHLHHYQKDAGPTNNWVQKDEMYARLHRCSEIP